MSQYRLDPEWTKETCRRVARETGLSESQVYKWGWDQRNKLAILAAHGSQQQADGLEAGSVKGVVSTIENDGEKPRPEMAALFDKSAATQATTAFSLR